LHRQTVRLSGVATGTVYGVRPGVNSFGQKAAEALRTGRTTTIGRTKSSILADFSSDGLQPARDWAALSSQPWIWVANASACPTCLSKHGRRFSGSFVPSHPSCLCIPQTNAQALAGGVERLSKRQLVDVAREFGDPRYSKSIRKFDEGLISPGELAQIENVNGQARGQAAWARHMAKQDALPLQGGGPVPRVDPTLRSAQPGQSFSEFGEFKSAEDAAKAVDAAYSQYLDDFTDEARAAYERIKALADKQTTAYRRASKARKSGGAPPTPKRLSTPDAWKQAAQKQHFGDGPLGPKTNAERYARMGSGRFSDDVAEEYAKLRSRQARIEYLEDAAQRRWPLHPDGTETLFDFAGMDPDAILANLDNLFDMAGSFRAVAEELRYIGGLTDTTKLIAANGDNVANVRVRDFLSRRLEGKRADYWASAENRQIVGQAGQSFGEGGGTSLYINPRMFESMDRILDLNRMSARSGWFPAGTDTATSTLTHEYGHLVDFWMDDIARSGKARAAIKKARGSLPTTSEYAKQSSRELFAEYFAYAMENKEFTSDTWKALEAIWSKNATVKAGMI